MLAGPFSLNHFTVKIDPGNSTKNVHNPKPTNDLSEPIKFSTTSELSATGTASLTTWFQLGGKHSTQGEQYWQPIQLKYLEPFGDSNEKHLTALWEFCYHDKSDSLDIPDELRPCAEFHVTNEPWPSISVTIACYYAQQQMLLRRRGCKVGWRNLCHSTHIVIPVLDWPKHEKAHGLELPIPPGATENVQSFEKGYPNAEGDDQKLIFHTSAECKGFVRQKSSRPCENRGHGRGPQLNSL
jgi:hypothetical protein